MAYEADDIDPRERLGWSVIVTGFASAIRTPGEVTRYEQLLPP